MSGYEKQVAQYLTAWNEDDEAKRRADAEQVFAENAHYLDPLASAASRGEIVATISAVRGQFPGWVFTQLGDVDSHNNVARFRWTLSPDGTANAENAPVIGFDVATFGEDGRIERVIGFLDKVPTA